MITAQSAALCIAFLLDFILGDPDVPLHPIRLMGKLISVSERFLRKLFPKTEQGEIAAGAVMTVFVVIVCGGVPFAVLFFAYRFNLVLGAVLEAVIAYFMIAAQSLEKSSLAVYREVKDGDLEKSRKAVSMIVGRDTQNLDETGVIKAAVETVAENTSDGVVAPIFYMALGGAALGCVYKAVNTMDSMVGYKNDRYINFGKCAARLDDALNLIPSRLSAWLMIASAFLLRMDFKNAVKIHRRDSKKHASPNSAQTESVCAGALDIELAGDACYFGRLYKKPTIGDDLRDIEADDIKRANALMYTTAFLALGFFTFIKLILWVIL